MYIDDVKMSNMMTTNVFNLVNGSAGGIISEHRFFESPSDHNIALIYLFLFPLVEITENGLGELGVNLPRNFKYPSGR